MSGGLVIGLSAVVTAALCAFGPTVVAQLPEPAPDSDPAEPLGSPAADAAEPSGSPAADADAVERADASDAVEPASPSSGPERPSYAEVAFRPHLREGLAVAGAIVGALVGWRLAESPALAAWLYLGAVGVVLSYVDARTRLLPTRLIAPSYAVLAALVCLAAVADGDLKGPVRSGLGWLAMGGFYVVLWVVYPRGLGYGDVRLSGLLGIGLGYVGWPALLTGLYAGFLLGGVGGALLAVLGVVDRKRLPFGPFMLLGALVGIVWGPAVADWYTSR